MIEHITTSTNWRMVEKLNAPSFALKTLNTIIEGCPYDIDLRIEFSTDELMKMGMYDSTGALSSDEVILYEMERKVTEREIEIHSLMSHRTEQVKERMRVNDTSGWRLEDWDATCPWLFSVNLPLDDEVAMQEKRDSWT